MSSTVASEDLLSVVRQWCPEHLRVESVVEAEELAMALARQVAQVIVSEGYTRRRGGRVMRAPAWPVLAGGAHGSSASGPVGS